MHPAHTCKVTMPIHYSPALQHDYEVPDVATFDLTMHSDEGSSQRNCTCSMQCAEYGFAFLLVTILIFITDLFIY